MGVNDLGIIGIGKDSYNEHLPGMIQENILPWVEDVQENGYPVWANYGAVQRSTYILDREGNLQNEFNITSLDPTETEDYEYLINLILDYRAENGSSVIRIPEDNNSIQSAIEASDDSDIILVSPGVYQERIDFLDRNITIASLLYTGFDPSLVSETILNGNMEGTVVTINGGQDASTILLGLTIENGYAEETGGGILIENSSPSIDRNIIRNNVAGSCGGEGAGLAIWGDSYPLVIGNKFYENIVQGECDCICYFGGAIYVDSTAFPLVGGSEKSSNYFNENYSDYGYDLYRSAPMDTTDWVPIYAHHNYFETCPPEYHAYVYPQNGWDLENCHILLDKKGESLGLAEKFHLFPNYPNPFNSTTTIRFQIDLDLANSHEQTLTIFDIGGRMVEKLLDQKMQQGQHEIQWIASDLPSGVYFIQLRSNNYIKSQKILLLK